MTNSDIDLTRYPFIIEVEGGTSCADDLSRASLLAYSWFGHRTGTCIFDEYNCESGRCVDICDVDSKDFYVYDETNSFMSECGFWYDEHGRCHTTTEPEGPYCFIYGIEHSHLGSYCMNWGRKTGYDYGIEFYRFGNRDDASYFVLMLSALNIKAKFSY